jgi:ComF family protein
VRSLFPFYPERIVARALDFIFPPHCLLCDYSVVKMGTFCASCWKKIHFLESSLCDICGAPLAEIASGKICLPCQENPPQFVAARAAIRYTKNSKALVRQLKFSDQLHIAPYAADWMLRAGRDFFSKIDIIIPVPLHRFRLWRRRYNQSGLLAKYLARKIHIICQPQYLKRRKATREQAQLTRSSRQKNIQGAFHVPRIYRKKIADKTILLIDDVMTTGATANAAAKELKRAGAKQVYVLTLAHRLAKRQS